MTVDLDEQDRDLRNEADALLERFGVMAILETYGRPHLSGSYALQLMTWRDLDFYLEMEPVSTTSFLELGRRLGEALRPRKLSYTDHFNFPTTEAVTGLYWGIQTAPLQHGGWKIDLWGVTPKVCAEKLRHCESIGAALTDATREAILKIKNEVCRAPGYRDTITSQHVYDAVLQHGARSIDDFRRLVSGKAVTQ